MFISAQISFRGCWVGNEELLVDTQTCLYSNQALDTGTPLRCSEPSPPSADVASWQGSGAPPHVPLSGGSASLQAGSPARSWKLMFPSPVHLIFALGWNSEQGEVNPIWAKVSLSRRGLRAEWRRKAGRNQGQGLRGGAVPSERIQAMG